MTRPIRPETHATPIRAGVVVRRLARIGIRAFDIPRNQGVGPHGYRTLDTDRNGHALLKPPRRAGRIATTDHPWHAPTHTILGILAAVRSLDRVDHRNTLIHPHRHGDLR